MKVFWTEKNNLWNKAKNIIKLYKNDYLIPETIIIEYVNTYNKNILNISELLNHNKKYILRPSFNIEDWENKSFAWFFNSIYPLNKNEVITYLKQKNLKKSFWWDNKTKLLSIIIQEFIETNIYGVYFTRNPNNIFKKWYYEIWKTNKDITSWNKKLDLKLNFFQEKELNFIWQKLEKLFLNPQDIEFCIKDNKIIILQTRNITTWNYTIYNFSQIQKFNWIYTNLDFDELWEKSDYFSYKILKWLFNCIYLDSKIYFKKTIIPYYLFKKVESKNKK